MKKYIDILLPLVMLAVASYSISSYGTDTATVILGITMLYYFNKSTTNVKRYMITLIIITAIYETANVASGKYAYTNVSIIPFWVPIGWSILGWWALNLRQYIKLEDKHALAFLFVVQVGVFLLYSQSLLSILIALTGIWVIAKATTFKISFFIGPYLAALLIEFMGTYLGLWVYSSSNGLPGDWIILAFGYVSVIGFCLWLAGIKSESDINK